MPEEKESKKFLVKIHKAYREIVAVSDMGLLGRRFEQDNLQLEVNEHFYGGKDSKVVDEKKLLKILQEAEENDACFNFVGKESVATAIKQGLINKNSVIKIQGIPHALVLI
ncbi:MAG: DUF424 family protein [Candidatus Pacearchaeota archaeon]